MRLNQSVLFAARLRFLFILLSCCLLTACTSGERADQLLENYRYRLSNVFELTPVFDQPMTLSQDAVAYPRQKRLKRQIPQLNINLLDFLRLSRCDLQRLLGQRNSSLGRVIADSQLWLYELEFIQLAERCLETLSVDTDAQDLVALLVQAIDHKRTYLPDHFWNATWASQEFQTLFSAAGYSLTLTELQQRPVLLEQALQSLAAPPTRWQSLSSQERRQLLEQSLSVVGSEKYMGRLRRTMNLVSDELNFLTIQISKAQSQSEMCPAGRLSERAKVMETVFQKFYIGEVQPLASYVHQRVTALRVLLLAMAAEKQAQPEPLKQYVDSVWSDAPDSEWSQFNRRVKAHTRLWQTLLNSCGLAPTA